MKGSFWESHKKPPACSGCPLVTKGRGFVPGYGEVDTPKLIILMERPGENEVIEGKPAVGKSGYHVDKALGGTRDGIFLTNVRKCVAPSETPTEKRASTVHCIAAYLEEEFNRLAEKKPKGLLLVGADAVQAGMQRGNISKLHNSMWAREEVEAMVRSSTAPTREEYE